MPCSCRQGEALIGLEQVAGIGFGIQPVGAQVQRPFLPAPLNTLRQVEEFTLHVSLETGTDVVAAFLALDFDETGGQVTVLRRWNASHNLDALDIVGRNGAHIHAGICEVAARGLGIPGPVHELHVGIGRNGCAIDKKTGAQRRGVVVRRTDTGLTKGYGIGRCQRGVLSHSTGNEFQNVGKRRRLEMLHCLLLDDR